MCYSRRVWHITRLMHGNQHSQHPKKLKKKQETRRQVSQWMAEDSRVKEKSSWYVKKTEEKGKRRWLLFHMKQYKSCCWRTFVIRKCNIARYLGTFCWSMIMMMKWLCTYWPTNLPSTKKLVSTNQQANESYSRSSFTRSILA